MSFKERFRLHSILLSIVLILIVTIYGCDDDDDLFSDYARIEVCNYDNHEYHVKLHRSDDDSIVDEIELDEGIPFVLDYCEEFDDVEEGGYFLTIHEHSAGDLIDTSEIFHIEEDEIENFYIDDSGELHRA